MESMRGDAHGDQSPRHGPADNDQVEEGFERQEENLAEARPVWLSEANLQSAFHLNYEVIGVIGCGSFGRVYQVRPREEEGKVYAAKVCDLRKQSEDDIRQEYDILALVPRHDNCVQVIEAYFENPYSYIILESCSRPLVRAIARNQVISESSIAFYFKQVFRALEAIHTAHVIHGDVKLDNLMVQDEIVKLIDFGQSVKMPRDGEGEERSGRTSGTPPFMSPEIVRGDGYGTGTDVWSLGVCIYTCMFGRFPYNGLAHDPTVMKAAIRLGIPEPAFCFTGQVAARMGPLAMISEDAEQFLRRLLQRRPTRRPTAVEALQHAWISRADGVANPGANIDFRVSLEAAWKVGAFSGSNPHVNDTMDQDMLELQAHANDFIGYCSARDGDDTE